MKYKPIRNFRILKTRRKTFILTAMLLFSGIAQAQVVIEGNVYGGGNIGEVTGNTTVTVKGGTVGRKLTLAERTIDENGQVIRVDNGNVYGGGNGYKIDGYRTIQKDDGYGVWEIVVPDINKDYGRVKGNTTVTIGGNAVVRRAVYGGGNIATVGDATIPQNTGIAAYNSGGKATVTIEGNALIGPKKEDLTTDDAGNPLSSTAIDNNFKYLGANEGFVFGSSRGISGGALKHLSFADTTIVTITDHAQVAGHVFGGGENGHVQKGTNVIVNGDAIIGGVPLHGDSTGVAAGTQMVYHISGGEYVDVTLHLNKEEGELNEDSFGVGHRVFRGNVFGGGKGTDFISWWKEQPNFNFNKYCYTAGRVYGNTHVTIGGNAQVYNRVYGGGTIASVGTFKYEDSSNANAVTGIESGGLCDVTINGGIIGSTGSEGKNCGEVFGGGRGLPGRPRKGTEDFQTIHQLPDEAYAGRTHVTVTGGTIMNSVYGGAANGHVQGNALVEITGGTIGTETSSGWHGNVFAGGGGTAQYTDTKTVGGQPVTFTKHSITAGRVFGDATLSISGGKVYHNVYGGGAIASIGTYLKTPGRPYESGGHVNVTVTGGTIGTHGYDNGMVFGSGRGQIEAPDTFMDSLTYVAYSTVNIGTGTVNSETGVATGISGSAKIKGSVYGSGENGHVYLHSQVNVFSGTIGCSAADYARYLDDAETDSLAHFGNRGNVYGAGCGTDKYPIAGEDPVTHEPITEYLYNPNSGYVQGNTEVNIYGGYISRNVYGGGAMASVGFMDHTQTVKHDQTTTQTALSWPYKLVFVQIPNENGTLVSTGKASVNIRGGHIGTVAVPINSGNVFGSARGDAVGPLYVYDTLALVRETEIYINFTASGTTITDATANCITSSVYGSGENGQTYENTKVTLANGLIGGSVFGGGSGTDTYAVALKNPDYDPEQTTGPASQEYLSESQECSITAGKVYGNTEVNISGGTVLHNVYGGGNLASVGKGNYYGYGEMTSQTTGPATPYENSGICTVNINGGTIGTDGLPDANGNLNGFVYGSSKGTTFRDVRKNPRYDYSRDFFVGYSNSTVVTIGDAVGSETNPSIKGSVFGGGENGHVRWHTNVTVNNGEIGAAYEAPASYQQDTINKWVYRGNVYGAGRGIDKIGTTDEFCSSAGSVTLNTNVTVNGGTIHRNVYGGGSNASIGAPPTGFDPGTSKCTVNIKGGTIGETVTPDAPAKPYIYGGDIYGGSRGSRELIGTDNIGSFATVTETDVNIDSLRQGANTIVSFANVIGNVYGGGEVGQVKTNTNVDIAYGTVEGSVYGGGKGDETDEKAALVAGNATVNMTNGTVERSIYGGGELGNVGTYIDPNPTDPEHPNPYYTSEEIVGTAHVLGEPKACKTGTGLATVKLSGGMVGRNGSLMPSPTSNPDDDDRGWIFCGGRGSLADTIAGNQGCNPKANLFGIVGSTSLEISGGVVTASAYGGCENGLVLNDTYVKIAGGQIGTGLVSKTTSSGHLVGTWHDPYSETMWNNAITAINDGTPSVIDAAAAQFHECDAFPYGIDDDDPSTPIVYDVYDIYADEYDSQGGSTQGSNGHSFFGNVFGGGSGYYPIAPGVWRRSAGRVWGDTHVEITGGHILTSVYGGNETTDVMGKCTVEMSGGTLGVPRTLAQIAAHPVTCYLFGAGMGDPRTKFNTWTNVKEVEVNITGGTFFGSVFGGGEEGHVLNDVKVNIGTGTDSGTPFIGTWGTSYVDGNVFGGGRGFSGDALTAGTVGGNIEVNIAKGTMLGSVYGGGRLASVGTHFTDPNSTNYGKFQADNSDKTHGHVTINISGGTIGNDKETIVDHTTHTKGGNVFGGSMGRLTLLDNTNNPKWPSLAKVKETSITISGGTIKSNVYGGGEFGTVGLCGSEANAGNASITISGGTIKRNVYGGGYGSPITRVQQNDSVVPGTTKYASPMQIAGRVYRNTTVSMSAGTVEGDIFGGGEMASVGYIKVNDSIKHVDNTASFPLSWPYAFNYVSGTGKATVEITGGTVGTDGNGNGDVFGSGKGLVGNRYRMAQCANVNNTEVKISGSSTSIKGNVYGGGENGHVNADAQVTMNSGTIEQDIYGAGKGTDTYKDLLMDPAAPGTYFADSSLVRSITAGKVYGNTTVTMNDGLVKGNIYGGGEFASVGKGNYMEYGETGPGEDDGETIAQASGHTRVYVYGGTVGTSGINNGMVYGSSKGTVFATVNQTPRYNYSRDFFLGYSNNTTVVIGNGTSTPEIKGSVFGGGEDGHVRFSTNVDIKSGMVGEALASEANPDSDEWKYRGNVYGAGRGADMYDSDGDNIPDKYCPSAGSVTRNTTVTIEGGTIYRNVYGGGSMAAIGPPPGYTNDPSKCTVNITGGNIGTSNSNANGYGGYVYGASRGIACNDDTWNLTNPTTPSPYANLASCVETEVNISKTTTTSPVIYNVVFGGGSNGRVSGNTVVNMNGGTVVQGIYGAGEGVWGDADYTYDSISGRVQGSTVVNLMGGTVGHIGSDGIPAGHIFGGARRSMVWGNTTVNVGSMTRDASYGGDVTIKGSVYGANNYNGTPRGNATVNVYKTHHDPETNELGNWYPLTPHGTTPTTPEELVALSHEIDNFAIYRVFGGSNQTDYLPRTGKEATVHVYQCEENTIYQVFGGSDAANIGSATNSINANVIIDGGRMHQVFGGGNGVDADHAANIYGTATTNVEGGLIDELFGGSNNYGNINGINLIVSDNPVCDLIIGNGYGGGNDAPYVGDIVAEILCGESDYDNFYGGASHSVIYGNVTLNVSGGTITNLFGGSKGRAPGTNGTDDPGRPANIRKYPSVEDITAHHDDGTYPPALIALYDSNPQTYANNYAGTGGNVTVNLYGGTLTNVFGGSDANGNIEGVITVNVLDVEGDCPLKIANIYGASNNACYTPDDIVVEEVQQKPVSPVINVVHIKDGAGISKNVFGAGKGNTATTTSNPLVNIGYNHAAMAKYIPLDANGDSIYHVHVQGRTPRAFITGNVYGGGEEGMVDGSTTVNVYKGQVGQIRYTEKHVNHTAGVIDSVYHVQYDGINFGGNVFGGGKGSTADVDHGRVKKNATVNIKGGHVLYSVYGGGELGSVGQHTEVHANENPESEVIDFTPVENTGLTTVTVTGGQVGPAPRRGSGYNIPCGLNGLDGYVFGGGKGEGNDPINSTNPYGAYYQFANVNNTIVTVDIPANADTTTNRLWGSVFGGAEDGHVLGNARVNYVSGFMGTQGKTSYDGNIFGGGRNYAHKNYTAGRVAGNTTVVMSGGQLFGNIYGGGRLGITGMSLIGMIPATELGNGYYQAVQEGTNHGNAKVIVKGGTIGNNTVTSTGDKLIETFTEHSMGSVYGGGMGTMDGIDITGHPKASSLLFGMTKNTEVIVKDSIDGNTLVVSPHIYGIVFGGGEIANVGKFTWKQDGVQISKVDVAGEGTAKVSISGGIIGGDRTRMRDDHSGPWLTYNDDLGYVYGGGEGLSDDPQKKVNGVRVYPDVNTTQFGDLTLLDLMSTVYKTEVEISGGWVKASVFGGSESGHVMNNTKVTIAGGQIGAGDNTDEDKDELYDEDDFINPITNPIDNTNWLYGTAHWPYGKTVEEQTVYTPFDPVYLNNNDTPSDGRSWFGNVFGGGSGWFPYVTGNGTEGNPYVSHWNPISGKVWGNTEVIITGGHILNNVYGANESTDVGGKATIRMSGGTVGVPRTVEQILEQPTTSYVFGAGAGDPRRILNVTTNVDTTDVQITGGIVYGAVFGGGEMGHVVRGTSVSIGEAEGKTTVIGSTGFSGYDGHVYGGGKGDETDYDPVPAVAATETTAAVPSHPNFAPGRVGGNTKVTMSKGTVLGNLYGGGMIARTGVGVEGDFEAFVTGEGENRQYDSIRHGMTMVEVRGGIIGVGGTKERALAMLTNEQKTGNVYGGGRGKVDEYIEDDYGRSANAVVYIHNTNLDTIYGSVYGGGQMANVGHWNNYSSWYTTHTGATSVTIKGNSTLGTKLEFDHDNYATTSPTSTLYENTVYETINNVKRLNHTRTGNVYGGGQGDVRVITVNGKKHAVGLEQGHCHTTRVSISGTPTIRSCVFGGSNEGAVWGDTKVTIEGGTIGTTNIKADTLDAPNHWVPANNKYSFGSVFGGSFGLDSYTHLSCSTHVVVDSVNSLAGRVYGNTEITISGGTVCENVYGGGNLASVGEWTVMHSTPTATDTIGLAPVAGTGHSKVTISGTAEIGPMDKSSMNAYVFGGGKGITYDSENRYKTFCNSNSTEVIVALGEEGRIFGSVFGGAGDAHVLDSTSVTINSGTIGTTGYGLGDGCVYGGGGNLAQSNYVAGRVGGNIGVTMTNGHVLGNVYGGGYSGLSGVDLSGETYASNLDDHGNVTINISGGTIGTEAAVRASKFVGHVFGSGKGDASDDHFGVTQSTDVTVSGTAQVLSNVYGGGETANVERNSAVNIEGGTIGVLDYVYKNGHTSGALDSIVHVNNTGNVFGGGRGVESSATVALVKGNANVNISGGHVYFNVYGGGEKAAVGRANTISSGEPPVVTDLTPVEGTGYTKVKVTGGQVGPAPRVETGYNIPIGLNGLDGYVYGGGKGIGEDPITPENPYGQHYNLANVNYACVEVNIPADADTTTNRIWGSIFGGAEDGHVLGSDTVKLVSGLIGTDGTTSYDGNIFGGGRNFHKKNYTAGRTRGNITVEMSGGQLLGSLFGGGRLALTGIDLQGNIVPDVTGDHPEKFGFVKVKVSGGKVGNDTPVVVDGTTKPFIETFTKYSMGEVFGGGKGDMTGIDGHPAASALLISLVHNTEVEISGDARIYGSVYGGGEVANVGEFLWDQDTTTYAISNIRRTGGGHSKVTVSGGTIGADRMRMDYTLVGGTGADKYNLKYNTDVGHVCGGGKGIVDNPDRLVPGTTTSYYGTANVIYGNASAQDVSLLDVMATVNTTEVIIKEDAYVKGSVFGGAMNGHVLDSTYVNMEGGQIGAGNGATADLLYTEFVDPATASVTSSMAPTYHWDYGRNYTIEGETVKRYDPFDPILVSQDTLPSDGRTWFGNLYGGGSGYYPYIVRNHNDTADSTVWNRNAGIVRGNTRVKMTGGHVLSCVYGGCETTDVLGHATVILEGGSSKPTVGVPRVAADIKACPIPSYVYGSGNGDPRTNFNTWTNVDSTYVKINNSIVYGSVFGGGMDGHVLRNTHVEVLGGTIGTFGTTGAEGNVFGGGRGSNPVALTAGGVGGNTRVDIKDGRMLGSIFGGGNNGSVGIQFTAPDASNYGEILDDNPSTNEYHGYTTVNISGGSIGHDDATGRTGGNVYGGCRGMAGAPGSIYQRMAKVKTTHVNISEASGKPTFIRGSVFGGGEDGHVLKDTYVNIHGGQIGGSRYGNHTPCPDPYHGNVYGGGRGLDTWKDDQGHAHYSLTAGKVYGNSNVNVYGGNIIRNVYGGGNIASVGDYRVNTDPETGAVIDTVGPMANTGLATVCILGGTVGLDNNTDNDHGNVFGSSHGIAGHDYKDLAFVHNAIVEVDSVAAIYGSVFGGGEDGHVTMNTVVNVSGGTIGFDGNNEFHGNVYGGGRGIDKDEQGHYSPTAGEVYGKATVNIQKNETYDHTPTIYHNVYGGGSASVVHVSKVVNVSDGNIKGSVFGGSRHIPEDRENKSPRFVNMWGGTVDGDVYGCSYQGIDGDPANNKAWASFINMSGGTVKGSVYGAGYQGSVKGSVGVLIGKNAIEKYSQLVTADSLRPSSVTAAPLDIKGNVYAGSNFLGSQTAQPWRTFDITGYSNVYIDGDGYNTGTTRDDPEMIIRGGVFGSGTNCESGAAGRDIVIRKYGERNMYDAPSGGKDLASDSLVSVTRTLTTIQRVGNLFLDHANIALTGARDISNLDGLPNTYYGVYQVDTSMVVSNGSSIVLGNAADPAHIVPAYIDSVKILRSVRLDESIYDKFFLPKLSYTWIGVKDGREDIGYNVNLYYNGGTTVLDRATEENVIIFKGLSQLFVRYHIGSENQYGELQGFFRMSSPYKPRGTESFAYARQKVASAKDDDDPNHLSDGGFASYYSPYNFFTDNGEDYTKTKQYPYTNIITDPVLGECRGWFIPDFGGNKWYVDGTGTRGGNNSVLAINGGGHYPDMPKLTIVGSDDATHSSYSIMGDNSVTEQYRFNSETDIIYVVGAVSGVKELVGNTSGKLGPNASHSTLPLRIYRYPGGHLMSNGFYDYGPSGEGTTKGPGPWYGTMLSLDNEGEGADQTMTNKTLVLDSVMIDGLYGVTSPGEIQEHEINLNVPSGSYYHDVNTTDPLATVNKGTLLMKGNTELKRGYNNHDAAANLGTEETPNYNFYVNPDFDNSVINGAGVYVAPDASAKVQVEGIVTITGNKQKKGSGTIESNVYLPTFDKSIEITDALDASSVIGVTSPKRNKAASYEDNTFSPVAVGVRSGHQADDAQLAWTNNNFRDDQGWFFSNHASKDTYYLKKPFGKDEPNGTINERTVYFGWTWANVVRTQPAGYAVSGNNITVSSEEGLAWLISQTTAINGAPLTNFSGKTISLTNDLNLRQYVWVPIGSEINDVNNRKFSGTFDGQGHLIDSLFIEYTSLNDHRYGRTNYGLFGDVAGGKIKRTFVVGGLIQPSSTPNVTARVDYNIGGLVGYLENLENVTAVISESEAAVKVYLDKNENVVVGGLVGQMSDGEVHSSMAMPDIVMGAPVSGLAGGLVGKVEGGKVNNSFVNAMFSIMNTENQKLGGLLGSNANATVENCYVNMRNNEALPQNDGYSDGIVYQVGPSSRIDYVYVKPDVTFNASQVGTQCKHYTAVIDADNLGYMYADNKVEGDTAMFMTMNRWVTNANNSTPRKYARWARPGLAEINGDLPVLLLDNYNASGKIGAGDFRNMGTYAGGPALQYGGPVRDGEADSENGVLANELDAALTRPLEKNKSNVDIPDYLFVYGDVNQVGSSLTITQSKVSIHEDVSIMGAGDLTTFDNTYVGITFDNSYGKATSTPGINEGLNGLGIGPYPLPRDWHMFSTPLSNAPLGFNYGEDNNPEGPSNNPWESPGNEFNWLNGGQPNGNNRYWMKNYDVADGYFPTGLDESVIPQTDDLFIVNSPDTPSDECPASDVYRYPYGMDFYTWNEPEYHWINFKRNGPNHWHSDTPHVKLDYVTEVATNHASAETNINESVLISGKGYMAAITKATFMQSHGLLNSNENKIMLSNSGYKMPGWNLVGNPFHGYLDFDLVAQGNGGENGVLSDQSFENLDGNRMFYVVYNADKYQNHDASTAFRYYPVGGSMGGDYAERFLHPHQGFYVKAKKAGNLTLNESMLVPRSKIKGGSTFRDDRPAYPLVNLYLSSDQGCADVTVIEFERPEWGGATKLKELRVGDGLFYAQHDNTHYAALFAQQGIDRVPVWFEAKEDDIFTLKWNTANADFHSMYLIDHITGIEYDMLRNDTYTFEGHKGDYPSRFLIVFSLTDVEEHNEIQTFVFFDGSQWIVTGDGQLDFVDPLGQVLMSKEVHGGQSRVGVPDVAPGVYLFRLTNSEGTRVQKVIVKR